MKKIKKISIALQGGGSHGAFAWGVLDQFLADGRFDIQGISGTSAGGMNAAAAIQGLIKGGNEEARKCLNTYWREMSNLSASLSLKDFNPFTYIDSNPNLNQRIQSQANNLLFGQVLSHLSPYDINPLNINPFQDFIRDFFNFDLIQKNSSKKLFLAATHVKTGKIKIFNNQQITEKTLMASACLPQLFQAVEIDGEHYWDGGFIANPALYPLIDHCDAHDIVLIQLRKTHIPDIPTTMEGINDRLKEITFNGCLLREMRAIYFITNLIDKGFLKENTLKRMNMHLIHNENAFKDLNLSSALNTDWNFLEQLFEAGRQTAITWIHDNFDNIGKTKNQDLEHNTAYSNFLS